MKQTVLLFSLCCLPAAPLLAQPVIGGGTCDSSALKGLYAISFSGRQVSSAGAFTGVIQANGAANFDGLSKVTITLIADTNQALGASLSWSGTYSLQADCTGVVTINTGGNVTFNVSLNAGGAQFIFTGADANYSYSGTGDSQPSACGTSLVSGVYTLNATGFSLSGTTVNGSASATGLMQFDGQGHATVIATLAPSALTPATLTGTYSITANCLGTGTLSDGKGNTYGMTFSVFNGTAVSSIAFYVSLAQNSKFITSGGAHAIFGQPTARLVLPPGLHLQPEGAADRRARA